MSLEDELFHPLEAISPIDGRYRHITEPLADYFSEKALIKYRILVEGEYLIHLQENIHIPDIRQFTDEEKGLIRSSYPIGIADARLVKAIEKEGYKSIKATNHDVKAVEYYLKDRFKGTSLEDCLEFIHFGLTSEDINNIAYALMISDSLGHVILPAISSLSDKIEDMAIKYKAVPMLARTHGQPASPTTVGKEFKVFSSRLVKQLNPLYKFKILAKLNGATSNDNARHVAYPNIGWHVLTEDFIESFNENREIKLQPNFITTQIESHDTYAELFDNVRRLNTVLVDFSQDIWRYISDDWFKQKLKEGEIGSSTMPQKINPIDFENGEKNLKFANSQFEFFSRELPISRLQRDLSDSTAIRNFGVAFAHSIIGYYSLSKGLDKILVNEEKIREELNNHPEVISEAYQTILRRERMTQPYEALSKLTRGKKVTLEDLRAFPLQPVYLRFLVLEYYVAFIIA